MPVSKGSLVKKPETKKQLRAQVAALRESLNAASRRRAEDLAAQREREADAHRALIAQLVADFYRAYANIDAGFGAPEFRHRQFGIMDHVTDLLARLTGKDKLAVGFRLDNGIPPGADGDGWYVVNEAPVGCPGALVLYGPNGARLDRDARLQDLITTHRDPFQARVLAELRG